jgi:hypothetical protein
MRHRQRLGGEPACLRSGGFRVGGSRNFPLPMKTLSLLSLAIGCFLYLSPLSGSSADAVRVWEEPLVLPTCQVRCRHCHGLLHQG